MCGAYYDYFIFIYLYFILKDFNSIESQSLSTTVHTVSVGLDDVNTSAMSDCSVCFGEMKI